MTAKSNEMILSSKVWNVKNINTIAEPLGNDYYICSGPFKNKAYPTVSWEICIYLNGYQGGLYGSVNVSLRQMGLKGNDCVKAKYYFYAIQNNGIRMDIGRASHNFKYWTQTSKYNVNMQSLLQHNGSITLGCEVEFTLEDLTLEYVKKDESALYSKALLQNMWQNKEFMDCAIEIGDVSINAHRSVLAQNSKVFRRMLYTSGFSEAQNVRKTRKRSYQAVNNGIVKITDCSSECFQAMLEYCYTGIVSDDIMNSLAEELFAAVAKCISQNRDILTTAEWEDLKRSHGDLTHRLLESVIFGQAKCIFLTRDYLYKTNGYINYLEWSDRKNDKKIIVNQRGVINRKCKNIELD
uniref:BTB domain-containing protein n=1 Tax=Meloidogyne javanica TaxID=6303 RepID=A0A915LVF4_MELJA